MTLADGLVLDDECVREVNVEFFHDDVYFRPTHSTYSLFKPGNVTLVYFCALREGCARFFRRSRLRWSANPVVFNVNGSRLFASIVYSINGVMDDHVGGLVGS